MRIFNNIVDFVLFCFFCFALKRKEEEDLYINNSFPKVLIDAENQETVFFDY